MKKMDFVKLVELMEKVKEVAGKIQLECIKEQPDMVKVILQLRLLEPIWQLWMTAERVRKCKSGRMVRKGSRSKRCKKCRSVRRK